MIPLRHKAYEAEFVSDLLKLSVVQVMQKSAVQDPNLETDFDQIFCCKLAMFLFQLAFQFFFLKGDFSSQSSV